MIKIRTNEDLVIEHICDAVISDIAKMLDNLKSPLFVKEHSDHFTTERHELNGMTSVEVYNITKKQYLESVINYLNTELRDKTGEE